MDAFEKLRLLDEYMNSEVTEVCTGKVVSDISGCSASTYSKKETENQACENRKRQEKLFPIEYAAMPNGKRIPLLKTALTTACERNCTYCAFRSGRDFSRQSFSVDEMAATFMKMYAAGIVEGLFISSGVAGGGVKTQDRLLACAEILRQRYQFKGYVHLKIMPGAEKDQVIQGMRLADRVSVNLESPTSGRLQKLAPQKQFIDELLAPLRWVEQVRKELPAWKGWGGRWPSSTTQFVVGAIDETDVELLQITSYLHSELKLSRVYYSGFAPVRGTPLENQPAVDPLREIRLYQSDFLLRDYGFDFEELEFSRKGFLALDTDPKVIWANQNLRETPLEVNKAEYRQLIRVPGIGPIIARRILEQRRLHTFQSANDLHKTGVAIQHAAPYILLNGKRPAHQLSLNINFSNPY